MMSKENSKNTTYAKLGGRSANQITSDEALIYALSTNMLMIAMSDLPDAQERLQRARHQMVREQPNIKLAMRRQLENVESFALDGIAQRQANNLTVH